MSKITKPNITSKPSKDAVLAFVEAKKPGGKRAFNAPEGYRRLTINLDENLHKRLRLLAIEEDCTATDIVVRLLAKELQK